MTRQHIRLATCGAAVLAAFLAGCHHDNAPAPATPPPTSSTTENFSTFATTTFKVQANATPTNFDDITLVYDVNADPTAFDALLM